MTHKEFEELFNNRIEALRETGRTKGVKYTIGRDDRLCNFKESVSGVTPLQVWEIFFRKHWASIEYFLKTGKNFGEDICDTHIHDCIMYLFLLEGLITEAKETSADEQYPTLYSGLVKCITCNDTLSVVQCDLTKKVYCANCSVIRVVYRIDK